MKPIIIIPARLKSSRLPNKPLADINGKPMIQHCWEMAKEAGIGPVVIAAGDKPIFDLIRSKGGTAILTDPDLPTGSDRVWAALQKFDPDEKYNFIINLQGDQPFFNPKWILKMIELVEAQPEVDLCSMATLIDEEKAQNPNDVKAVLSIYNEEKGYARCLYCSRNPVPHGGPFYYHVGVYGFKRKALETFVASSRTYLEKIEDLEQLRVLELGMRFDNVIVDAIPLSVDTAEDLTNAREFMKKKMI